MPAIYSANTDSQDLRWGDPAAGALANVIPLGFNCFQLAAMPDQRHLYVTGYRQSEQAEDLHFAWLAVVDTCTNTVTAELDLGVGHAGQCAVPPGVNGNFAFVAISQAQGMTDTGPHGGSNRIEVLDISDVAHPVISPPAVAIGGSAYGTLFVVWSNAKSLLYTSHRGDGDIFAFPPTRAAPAQRVIPNIGQQPTGLAVDALGLRLYVGRRLAGEIYSYDLAGPSPVQSTTYVLPNGASQSAIYIAVDRFDRLVAASNRPGDGICYRIDPVQPQAIVQIDTQGSALGKPAVTPDASRAYVPRGGQNDLAEIDLAANALLPAFISVGNRPNDTVVVSHEAGQRLEATPSSLAVGCQEPTTVTVRALDACGNEVQGVAVAAISSSAAVGVTPPAAVTPAAFQIECAQGGAHSVTFAMTAFPYMTLTFPVACDCPIRHCVDFSSLPRGPLPPWPAGGRLANIARVSVTVAGGGGGPQVPNSVLLTRAGTVLFVMDRDLTIGNLVVRYRRQDSFTPLEQVVVTHAGGTDVRAPSQGFAQGDFELLCPFQGITQWLLSGGVETSIRELCFDADFELPG